MSTCPSCHAAIDVGEAFCGVCGRPTAALGPGAGLPSPIPVAPSYPVAISGKPKAAWLAAGLLAIVAIVVLIVVSNDRDGQAVPAFTTAPPTNDEEVTSTAFTTELAPIGQLYLRPVLSQCQTLDLSATTSSETAAPLAAAVATTTSVPVPLDENGLPIPESDPNGSQYLPVLGADPPQYCLVGPQQGTGEVFDDNAAASIIPNSGWGVTVDLRDGAEGNDVWNAVASQCFNRATTCPTGQLALELDGKLQSVASVQTDNFQGSVQISGSFSEVDARNLALAINTGSSQG